MYCPIIVAQAAPAIPHPKPNTKSASKIVFTIAPVTLQIIDIPGLPSARIRWPPPAVKISTGKPHDVILR